jgi:hypothetical protein
MEHAKQMNIFKSALLVAIIFSSTPAFAFDDNRQGFMLGVGAGFETLKVGTVTGSMPKEGVATSLKIGWGITERIALYYVQNDSWYRDYPSATAKQQSTYTIGISGIGVTYFLAPTAQSGYILAAIGTGYNRAPFDKSVNPGTGSAFMIGGGYEYEKNLTVEGTLLSTRYDSVSSPQVSLKSTSIQMTINYLFY